MVQLLPNTRVHHAWKIQNRWRVHQPLPNMVQRDIAQWNLALSCTPVKPITTMNVRFTGTPVVTIVGSLADGHITRCQSHLSSAILDLEMSSST